VTAKTILVESLAAALIEAAKKRPPTLDHALTIGEDGKLHCDLCERNAAANTELDRLP